MRTNIYKEKILKLLNKNHLLSISDIHTKISNADYSTIYRNVEQLVSEQKLKKIVLDKDNIAYEMDNVSDKHDHFFCVGCGDVEEVHIPSTKLLTKDYTVTDVLVKGLCGDCNKIK